MADLEVYRSRHFGYLRPGTEAGRKFILEHWPPEEVISGDVVQFNLDSFEDIVDSLKEAAEGLDVEVR